MSIFERHGVLASIEAKATLVEEIKVKQLEDEDFEELKEKMVNSKAQETTLDANGALIVKPRICAPRVDGLIQNLLAKSHGSRYSFHRG